MATCPKCGVSSRAEPGALAVEEVLVAKPLGTWSLAGAQDNVVATKKLRLRCNRCGWSCVGHIEGDHFYADPIQKEEDPLE